MASFSACVLMLWFLSVIAAALRDVDPTLLSTCTGGEMSNDTCWHTDHPQNAPSLLDASSPALLHLGDTHFVYARSSVGGRPWGVNMNEMAMDEAFDGLWSEVFYEQVNASELMAGDTCLVVLEGSDSNANELSLFLANNNATIENFVLSGGAVFVNAAPNEGGDMDLPFGAQLRYPDLVAQADACVGQESHPIFANVTTNYTGNWLSHGSIDNGGDALLCASDDNRPLLSISSHGSGTIMYGALTTSNWHKPQPDAFDLRANIYRYLGSLCAGSCAGNCGSGEIFEGSCLCLDSCVAAENCCYDYIRQCAPTPTRPPTPVPTDAPIPIPTNAPTPTPTDDPTPTPTDGPTPTPTGMPTQVPTPAPTLAPTTFGSCANVCGTANIVNNECVCIEECVAAGTCCSDYHEICDPSPSPTSVPTAFPSPGPTFAPTPVPTTSGSCFGNCDSPFIIDDCLCVEECVGANTCCSDYVEACVTPAPTYAPTPTPTDVPTPTPTDSPTPLPTSSPSPSPTNIPTPNPTPTQTDSPTPLPTSSPSPSPTNTPTPNPTRSPSPAPTDVPTPTHTDVPTPSPTLIPTAAPTMVPTTAGSCEGHCGNATIFEGQCLCIEQCLISQNCCSDFEFYCGTPSPTSTPTGVPTSTPTGVPTSTPTGVPTSTPTGVPTSTPTEVPSCAGNCGSGPAFNGSCSCAFNCLTLTNCCPDYISECVLITPPPAPSVTTNNFAPTEPPTDFPTVISTRRPVRTRHERTASPTTADEPTNVVTASPTSVPTESAADTMSPTSSPTSSRNGRRTQRPTPQPRLLRLAD